MNKEYGAMIKLGSSKADESEIHNSSFTTHHSLVPRLRFPEFRDVGEWEEKELSQVCEVNPSAKGLPEKFVYIDLESVEGGQLLQKRTISRKGAPSRAQRLLVGGDIVFQMVRPYQKNNYFFMPDDDLDYVASTGYAQLRAYESNAYLFQYLHHDGFVNSVLEKCTGSNYPAINSSALSTIMVEVPGFEEQQKIADCLSSLDTLIAAQAGKIDALKTHKKGLMQQLFPREGETVPRLRFAKFRDAGEWNEVALGEIAEIKLGKMLDSKKHTTGNLLPYLNNLSVRWNDVDTFNLPKMYFDDDELDRFGLRAGDVVVCEGGEPGRSAVWDERLPNIKYQKAVHRVRFNIPFEPHLLVHYLESISGTSKFEKLFTGGGIKHLTRQTFARLEVPYISHDEQKRITDCLSSLDALIAANTAKLEALKSHKKGLMQQLFPNCE